MPHLHPASQRYRVAAMAILLALVTTGQVTTATAEDPSFVSLAKSYLDRAMKTITDQFGDDGASVVVAQDPDEVAREEVLKSVLSAVFLQEKGYHFTQSRWGAKTIPYQIDGLEVVELPGGAMNSADEAEKIDRRVTYEFQAKSFRLHDEAGGWGQWRKGNPPHLNNVTLIRQNGVWKVSISPARAYSLK